MTLGLLAIAWLGVAVLVWRPGGRSTRTLDPALQALVALLAVAALVLIPVSAVVTVLKDALATAGGGLGSCGRLVVAVARDPLARPGVSVSLLLLAAMPVRLGLAVRSAWRSQTSSRRLARSGGGGAVVAPAAEPFAFTAGLLRPRVVVSEGFMDSVPEAHRRVVLAHEEAHRRWRHPLLLFVVESLAGVLPLPPVRSAARMFRLALEAGADEHAASTVGSRSLVAETIADLALASSASPGFEGQEVTRVRRLLAPPSARRGLGAVVLVVGVLGAVAFAGTHAVHCAATSADALAVVQCRPDR